MSLFALGLVLVAAVLHTSWNMLLKRAPNRQFVSWWAMLVGALIFAPLLVLAWPLPAAIWPYALASAVVEAGYMLLLSHAYQHGDFSLVYPIARGSASALLTLWSFLLLGERPSAGGLLGLGLLIGGLAAIGLGHWWSQRPARVGWNGIGLALAVAVTISIYSAIDAAGVRIASPAAYNALVFGLTGVFQAPFMILRYGSRPALESLTRQWRVIVPIGILMLATYMLVLQAYATSTVSYVGAVREISIVLAAMAGWRWLGEGFGRLRMAGALLTFCGVLAIATLS
jgi:drug/metabolite transporter (DMT)-like permease